MANFAKIGLNNKVIEVVSLHDNETKDSNGIYSENLGIKFLTDMTGWAVWKQTFEDGTRKNGAAKNYTYDEDKDAFIPPKPFASWTLNETICQWQPPVVEPIDENKYTWNEETQQWDIVDNS